MGQSVSRVCYSAALTFKTSKVIRDHLLQHIQQGQFQEDVCFALWRPSTGLERTTALITEMLPPLRGERELHGGASFSPEYVERVISVALNRGLGIAFMHSHFTKGWQDMSSEDIVAEQRLAPRIYGSTGHPLVGLTMGTDGALSARFWTRIGRGKYLRHWCGTVRIVGEEFDVTFMEELAPKPIVKEALKRTISAWGEQKQALLARLHIGIVGLGSIGALVAEALARTGIENISLIDFDVVKEHNLDRLLNATENDVRRPKVDVAAQQVSLHATAGQAEIRKFPVSLTTQQGLKAALDCDVLFSCVDRPWPRQVLNVISCAHLIPVIDGGIRVKVGKSEKLSGADWRAHVVTPGRPCLECLGQFDPAQVELERLGLLDDPEYIKGLSRDHFIHQNENVFMFSMNAAGQMLLQLLSMVVRPSDIANTGAHIYHFVPGTLDKDAKSRCRVDCPYQAQIATGDEFPYSVV